MTQLIKTELKDKVLTLQINRPEKKNALTLAMYATLAEKIEQAQSNDEVVCLQLTGQPEFFCAGNDIQDFIQSANTLKAQDNPIIRFLKAIARNKKPIVAAANGHCVGIGATMLLHCDLVYLGDAAILKMPFVDLGLCPEAGASLLLPKIIGSARTNELLLLGKSLDALTAQTWGLANAVVPANTLQRHTQEAALQLASKPVQALKISRQLTRQYLTQGLINHIETEAEAFSNLLTSPEAMNAFMTFMKK